MIFSSYTNASPAVSTILNIVLQIAEIVVSGILSACLVWFGRLQWLAVKEQNEQNLFSKRLDVYLKIDELDSDVYNEIIKLKYIGNTKKFNELNYSSLKLNNAFFQIMNIRNKVKFLFNNELFKITNKLFIRLKNIILCEKEFFLNMISLEDFEKKIEICVEQYSEISEECENVFYEYFENTRVQQNVKNKALQKPA